jgi:hypothetical protein
MFHLPDLPTVGYSTQRERELTDEIMMMMREIERDRARLLQIVVEGTAKWRRAAKDAFGLRAESDALDAIYDYFTLQACPPVVQRQLLDAQHNPGKWKAIVREAMPEIEAQLEGLRLVKKWGV